MEVGSGEGRGRPHETDLTVVIPAFNEAVRLGDGLARLRAAADHGAIHLDHSEVLVVDDGSTDDTAARAKDLLSGLPHAAVVQLDRHRGKGAAVRAGVRRAASPRVAYVDADMAMDPMQLPDLVAGLDHHALSIGARTLPGSSVDVDQFSRTFGARIFNLAVNTLTGIGLGDTQCGFKAFRTPAARLLFHCTAVEGFAFDVEILFWARRLGLPITEVPVHWRRVEGSHVRPLRDSARMLGDVVSCRLGRDRIAPVPALAVLRGARPDEPSMDAVARAAGATLPVLRGVAGGTAVLLPLCDRSEVDATRRRLSDALPGIELRALSMPISDLEGLVPSGLVPPAATSPGTTAAGPARSSG